MMICFLGRSVHTIKMPNKPIGLGYKVLALCDTGYTYDWEYYFNSRGILDSYATKQALPTLTHLLSSTVDAYYPSLSHSFFYSLYGQLLF